MKDKKILSQEERDIIYYRIQDVQVRAFHNMHTLLDRRKKRYMSSHKFDKIRYVQFSNLLSSLYSLINITMSICKVSVDSEFVRKVDRFVKDDELLTYIKLLRNSEDHDPESSCKRTFGSKVGYTEIVNECTGKIEVISVINRNFLKLFPITQRGKITPIPTKFLKEQITNVTPEIIGEFATRWWLSLSENIKNQTLIIPESRKDLLDKLPEELTSKSHYTIDNSFISRSLLPMITLAQQRVRAKQIWLFGSRARGDTEPDSDWDIFLVLPNDATDKEMDPAYLWQIGRDAGLVADVVADREEDVEAAQDIPNTLAFILKREGLKIV